ncbi:MAG: hypothetical protein ABEN55_20295 [Bradymonadaceae bacterium]
MSEPERTYFEISAKCMVRVDLLAAVRFVDIGDFPAPGKRAGVEVREVGADEAFLPLPDPIQAREAYRVLSHYIAENHENVIRHDDFRDLVEATEDPG